MSKEKEILNETKLGKGFKDLAEGRLLTEDEFFQRIEVLKRK